MEPLDAAAIAQLAIRLGLLTEAQAQEAWDEVGERGGDLERFFLFQERKHYLTPYQSGKLLKGDMDGYFLGGYKLLYKIKSGSFGRVYRAEDPGTGRIVAIKVLRRRWMEHPQRIELFEREGKMGLSLRHPNIVEVLTVNRDPTSGSYYIVMEFVEGGNLRDILAIRGKFEPAEALRIVEDAASGLAYAYSRGVTHRDMKLTNVLLSSAGQAKLVDFGLAKFFALVGAEEAKVERTVDYAGLERATGVKSGDVRSDIYFLGCVLYELLAGKPPLVMTRDRHQRMQKHRFDSVQPMNPEDVKAPASVHHLVETMMSLEPQQRYQTPSQLVEAIRACRRELESGVAAPAGPMVGAGPRSVFVAESDQRLQDAIRDKFKELGYRVFLASDPGRALDRFRQSPYDALVVDVGTTGEDGLHVCERIVKEAERQNHRCSFIVVLGKDQTDWRERIPRRPSVAVLQQPGVTLKQLYTKLREMVPVGNNNQ